MFIVNQTSNNAAKEYHSNLYIFMPYIKYWIIVKKTKIINGNGSGKLGSGIYYTTDFGGGGIIVNRDGEMKLISVRRPLYTYRNK